MKNTTKQFSKLVIAAQKYVEKHFVAVLPAYGLRCEHTLLLSDLAEPEDFEPEKTFSERLLELVVATGEKDSEIYKRANVDRRLYSKIISKTNYSPSKNTVLAFVFALRLDLETASDLLNRAGYSLSHSVRRDLIIEYLLKKKVYDLLLANEILVDLEEAPIRGKNVA